MNLTAQVKLVPDPRQEQALTQTMIIFNDACNYVSKIAFKYKIYRAISLQNLKTHDNEQTLYYRMRACYPRLSSMQIQLVMVKVADAYKTRLAKLKKGKKIKKPCKFREMSSIPYNQRVCNYQLLVATIADKRAIPHLSLLVTNGDRHGRAKIDYVVADHQRRIFANHVPLHYGCESRLSFKKGVFYLNIPVEQCLPLEPVKPTNSIGVDLGVVNIATTSQGKIYNSEVVENARIKFLKHRTSLQKCGTPSAKRRLKQVADKEARFRRDINHKISKELVVAAEGTNSRIVLENLTHIHEQTTVRKQQRARHHSWSFAQLRWMIEYKAPLAGVEVKVVDPKYTSQRCSACGTISKSNRKSQFRYVCKSCGHDTHADYNAACNLRWLGNNGVSSLSKTEATTH